MDVDFLRYQFEDGYYGVITKSGFKIGVRHIQMFYMFASSIAIGIIRGSMGVAVLAITDPTRRDDTYIQIHNWDGRIQGAVLSSFFIGYAVMLVPSELFLRKVGGKILMTAIFLVNGTLSVAMPTIVNKGGWVAACNAKLFMGMSHACFNTVNQALLEIWLPPSEKKIFNCLVYGGVQIGIIIALPVSGMLSKAALGWELIYYALAMLGISMTVISAALTASSPEDHQAVGDAEKEFIKEALSYYRKKEIRKPYRDILKSSNFWATTCAHAASTAVFIFCLVYGPAYLMTFGRSLEDSAWYSMLPFMAMSVVYIIMSPVIDWIYRIKYLNYIFSASFFRKVINALGAFGIVMQLTMLPNFPREWDCPAIIVFTALLGLLGFQFCGFLSSYKDMTENYSGTVMMLSCAFSNVVGGCIPFLCGVMLGDNMFDPLRWRVIILTLACLYSVCAIIYTVLGSNERQHWDHINDKKQMGHLNEVMDFNQVQLEENGHTTYVYHKNEIDTAL